MASLNNVVLLGNLTRDPEVRYTPSGTPVATLGVAVNNRMKQGDEWKDDPCFI
ncbi:MAG TPA: single-stranded DNA-binding protein, partial [Gammaproteobacteria bacterium]|nr:single-stranded DNA-binding protein [Gammaproteobacteria bacterium]